ncbi:MAG TPA: ABC transporter permease [Chloroflexota bacterium]|nr:ABC transporter permease [Chloroflexota bacterium]
MGGFIVRRLTFAVLIVLGISLVTFVVAHAVPADPVRALAGSHATPSEVAAARRAYGLDKPLPLQYLSFLWSLAHGDLGVSLLSKRPVLDDLTQYLPATIELGVSALILTIIIGVPLGVLSALGTGRAGRVASYVARVPTLLGVAMPPFWLGLLAQAIVAGHFAALPLSGRLDVWNIPPPTVTGLYVVDSLLDGNPSLALAALLHLILPAVTLSFGTIALLTRMIRASMLDVLSQDYIRTARSKGLRGRVVLFRHAFRNTLVTSVTVVGLLTGYLLSGDFLVETVFSWPGIGNYGVNAAVNSDFPAIIGVTMLVAAVYVIVNLLVDLAYPLLDPRVAV